MKIWTVDAFTNIPFKGNPAAIAIVDEFPNDDLCLKIAAEMNLSETAFVKKLSENNFHIKWFTPVVEVELCGHATLAAFHVLCEQNIIKDKSAVFKTLSGDLKVEKAEDKILINLPLYKISQKLSGVDFKKILNINCEIIDAVWMHDDVVIEISDEKSLLNIEPNLEGIAKLKSRCAIVTARPRKDSEYKNHDFISRVFAPNVGVNEDPATGSAHCKLAGYWQNKLKKNSFVAYQTSKRGGELWIEIENERVNIKGNAITVTESIMKI